MTKDEMIKFCTMINTAFGYSAPGYQPVHCDFQSENNSIKLWINEMTIIFDSNFNAERQINAVGSSYVTTQPYIVFHRT